MLRWKKCWALLTLSWKARDNMNKLLKQLEIPKSRLNEVNGIFLNGDMQVMKD